MVACLTYNLWNPVNFAVLLAVWHCSVLVFDGIDSSEIHIHSQRITDLFLEQFLPGLTGQTLTQVAQCNIHLVLVAVFFAGNQMPAGNKRYGEPDLLCPPEQRFS